MSDFLSHLDLDILEAEIVSEGDLEQYGVKGMKWGVRRSQAQLDRAAGRRPEGVSRKTNREAQRDASRSARAKMYYGEGAGTRRKLLNAEINAKAKKDPSYKKAFDHHLERQDMGSHAQKARGERKRTDARKAVGKTARGVHRLAAGGFGSTTMTAAAVFSAYKVLKQTGADKKIASAGKKAFADVAQTLKNWDYKNGPNPLTFLFNKG